MSDSEDRTRLSVAKANGEASPEPGIWRMRRRAEERSDEAMHASEEAYAMSGCVEPSDGSS